MLPSLVILNVLALLANAQSFNITINIDPTAAREWFSTVLQNIVAQNLSQTPTGIEQNVSDQFVQIFTGQSIGTLDPLADIPASMLLADFEEPLTQNLTINALELGSNASVPKVTNPTQNRNWNQSSNVRDGDGFLMAAPDQAFDSNPATCKYAVVYRLEETKSMLRALGGDDWQLTALWPNNHYGYKIIESPIPTDIVFDASDHRNFTSEVVRLVGQNHGNVQPAQVLNISYLFDTAGAIDTPNTTLSRQLVANTSDYYAPGTIPRNPNTSLSFDEDPLPFAAPAPSLIAGSTAAASSYITAIQNAMYQERMNTVISYESVRGTVECYNDSLSSLAREAFRQQASVAAYYLDAPLKYNGIFGSDIDSGNGTYFNCTADLERYAVATRAHVENLSNRSAVVNDVSNDSSVLNISYAQVYRSNNEEELYSALTNGSDGNQSWVLPFGAGAVSGREINSRSFAAGMVTSDRVNATMWEHVEDFSLTFGFPNATLLQNSTSAPQNSSTPYDASLMTARTGNRVYIVVAVVNNCSSTA